MFLSVFWGFLWVFLGCRSLSDSYVMNKVFCHHLNVAHVADVELISSDSVICKDGKSMISLYLEDSAVYLEQTQSTAAGKLISETVTAKVRRNEEHSFLTSALKYYVLVLFTDIGQFVCGDVDYPAELTSSSDKIYLTLSFKVSKPG